jgi:hypothetical protein
MSEPTVTVTKRTRRETKPAPGGDALYAFGIFGASIYFWQRADSNAGRALAIGKGLVWPAFMVYAGFEALERVGRS